MFNKLKLFTVMLVMMFSNALGAEFIPNLEQIVLVNPIGNKEVMADEATTISWDGVFNEDTGSFWVYGGFTYVAYVDGQPIGSDSSSWIWLDYDTENIQISALGENVGQHQIVLVATDNGLGSGDAVDFFTLTVTPFVHPGNVIEIGNAGPIIDCGITFESLERVGEVSTIFNDDGTFTLNATVLITGTNQGDYNHATENLKMWVDLDGDGDITIDERVMKESRSATVGENLTFSATLENYLITAPENAYIGVRVGVAYYEQPSISGNWCWGDYYDYYLLTPEKAAAKVCLIAEVCPFILKGQGDTLLDGYKTKERIKSAVNRASDVWKPAHIGFKVYKDEVHEIDPALVILKAATEDTPAITLASILNDDGKINARDIDDEEDLEVLSKDSETVILKLSELMDILDVLGKIMCPDDVAPACKRFRTYGLFGISGKTSTKGYGTIGGTKSIITMGRWCGEILAHELGHNMGFHHYTNPNGSGEYQATHYCMESSLGGGSGNFLSPQNSQFLITKAQKELAYDYILAKMCHEKLAQCPTNPWERWRNEMRKCKKALASQTFAFLVAHTESQRKIRVSIAENQATLLYVAGDFDAEWNLIEIIITLQTELVLNEQLYAANLALATADKKAECVTLQTELLGKIKNVG